MLLHLLLHVLIFHLLNATGGQKDAAKSNVQHVLRGGHKDAAKTTAQQSLHEQKTTSKTNEKQHLGPPKDTNYVLKHIEKCPLKGYFFTRDNSPNKIESDSCYLCFCLRDNNAVCWKRDTKRCTEESLRYNSDLNRFAKNALKKSNDTRIRRSPGFTDIFFRDASRDMFNRNSEDKQCKPYESSFSDDCPPADWCTGCTVCDCDANGRWDCHILSFCNDPKNSHKSGRKMVKKKKVKEIPIGARPRTSMPIRSREVTKKTKSTPKKVTKKPIVRPKFKPKQQKQNNKIQKQEKKKPLLRYKRIAQKAKPAKPIFKKRNVSTHKRVHLQKKKAEDDTAGLDPDMAKQIMKRMMTIVNRLVQKEIHNMTKLVAQRQKWFEEQRMKVFTDDLTPRIIGGTRKRQHKTQIKVEKHESESHLRHKRHKRDLTTAQARGLTTTPSTMAPLHEISTASTTSPIHTEYEETYVGLSTKYTTDNSMPTKTNLGNDYYKYIVATNVVPLKKNKITTDTTSTISDSYTTNNTDRTTTDRIESTAAYKQDLTTEKENITMKPTENTSDYDKKNNTFVTTKKRAVPDTTFANTVNENTATEKILVKTASSDVPNPYKYLVLGDSAENDIKFNKYPRLRIIKETPTTRTPEPLTESILSNKTNETTVINDHTAKVHRKDVIRITVAKKYHLLKALNYYKCPFFNRLTLNNDMKYMYDPSKPPEANSFLTKLFSKYNSTKKHTRKVKKYSWMKYLRKLFNYVVKRQSGSDSLSRHQILDTLCEHFGPCNIKPRDKPLLKAKLKELKRETVTILKTVKIIKGLLILMEDTGKNKTTPKKRNLGMAIQRLNSILKGNYGEYSNEPLTATKITQIKYVKQNTQDFIKSVGRFATLLNEIIAIITKDSPKSTEKNNNKHEIRRNPFKHLKELLIKYNLVQNSFMRKMYDVVNSFENKPHVKPKVSAIRDSNSSVAMENFSRIILKNLRKLKHLAQTLNYNGRTKRNIKDDDALEYLLMLMEYLFKQHYPLDAAPANDGIDLLLEAIKNAPDIKTVRKKVLINTPSPSAAETTEMSLSRNILYRPTTESSRADPESDSDTMSNEDTEKPKTYEREDELKAKIEENKDLFDIVDEDKEISEKLHFDRRAGEISNLPDFTTSTPIYEEIENSTLANTVYPVETTQPLFNDEDNFDNSTYRTTENDNAFSYNLSNTNNFEDNTENGNVLSNTISNHYDLNTGSLNNDESYTPSPNVYIANVPDVNNPNAIDNDNYNPNSNKDLPNYNDKESQDHNNLGTEENVTDKKLSEEGSKDVSEGDKKMETIYAGEIDEEENTHGPGLGSEVEATTRLQEDYSGYNRHRSKEMKTLDKIDTDKLDKKSKLEWIEENFRREFVSYDDEKHKGREDKREDTKSYTSGTLAPPPSRTNAPEFNTKKPVLDISMISNEVSDTGSKKKKSKVINTEEVMYKKQMDLMNSLDYVTERTEADEPESKDGNINEEKYSETYPAYFV